MEELLGLAPEKVLLKWMNFHLKKVGYEKQVTNFSSDLKVSKPINLLILVVACQFYLQKIILVTVCSAVPIFSFGFKFLEMVK